jgi:signal transduction histidine kinase
MAAWEAEAPDTGEAAGVRPVPPPTPSGATADLEAAFVEGLAIDVDESEATREAGEALSDGTSPIAAEDPSRAMTEEAFGASARTAVWIETETEPPIEFEVELEPEAEAPQPPPGAAEEASAAEAPATSDWRRLARSLSHEIRNPLVSIRTFAELLPEHFEDASFRERFTELVGRDVRHIDDVIDRLARAAEREKPEPAAVDVSAMIERLLDARRTEIGERRLLVLRELEREAPVAWADAQSLEIALSGLLDRALASLPERGDLFVATRRIERGSDGAPRLRVLMRHHSPELAGVGSTAVPDAALAANAIEYVLAETVVSASGGRLTIDATDAQETLILIDLRTPADAATAGGEGA